MKISIITITYNSAGTLRDTFESVMRQRNACFEHIVIDGGSKDDTLDIIREYENKYKARGIEFKWKSGPDKGIYDAMNKGIGMATGDVVGMLNSDDFYTSDDALAVVADTFNANSDIDATYGDVHFILGKDLTKCVRYYSSQQFSRAKMRMGLMPAHPSFFMKKATYERYKLSEGTYYDTSYKVAADFELLLRVIFKNNIRTHYIQKDFVTMRAGGASTNGIKAHLQIQKDHNRAFRENGVYSNIFLQSIRYVMKLKEFFVNTKNKIK